MNQHNINFILAFLILSLFIADLVLLVYVVDRIIDVPGAYIVIFPYCCLAFLLIIVIFAVLLFVCLSKNVIKRWHLKIGVIIFAFILVMLVVAALITAPTQPVAGVKLYSFESDSFVESIEIYGNYVTWLENNGVYVMDISSEPLTSLHIGSASHGPVIYGDKVVFEYHNIIYLYSISSQNITILTNGSGESLDVYGDFVIWFENESIHLYNISNDVQTIIKSENITKPVLICGNYIIWKEFKGLLPDEYWKKWMNLTRGYNNAFASSGIFDIWVYDISFGNKTKVISNVMQTIYFNGKTIDVYKGKIAYTHNISIYVYDVSNNETTKIIDHSKMEEITSGRTSWGFKSEGYLYDIDLYDDTIIYKEHYSSQMGYSETYTLCSVITSQRTVKLGVSSYDMYRDSIVGWTTSERYWKNKRLYYKQDLRLIDLKDLF